MYMKNIPDRFRLGLLGRRVLLGDSCVVFGLFGGTGSGGFRFRMWVARLGSGAGKS